MKLTRMFILKAFDEDNKNYDNENPINSFKNLLITNSNLDILITFILSLLYAITLSFINNEFYEVYPINFIVFVKLSTVLSTIFLIVEYYRITIIIWENYLRSLNKPQNVSERSSLQSNNSRNSINSRNSRNSINSRNNEKKSGDNNGLNFSFKKRIEMDDLKEDKKSPFLPKIEKNEEDKSNNNEEKNKDINGSSKDYIFKDGNKFNIMNNKKDYIESYYESILSSPNNTFYDKFLIKKYIDLIKKLNKIIDDENKTDINSKKIKISIYKIIIKYPLTISSIFHFLKNILFLFSFGLSLAFWILYSPLKPELKKYSFNVIHIFIGQLFELYCLFRLCFFFIKIIVNFFIFPLYISAIYLGYYEDYFNVKLNELIKTRFYTGKKCLISRDSINKMK